MKRTKQNIRVGYNSPKGPYYVYKYMTIVDGLGIMQECGNAYYSVTLASGKQEGRQIATANTFYEAVDFARTLMQNHPDLYELIENHKVQEVVNACRDIQFMLRVHFGTEVELPFGNFNSNLKN